MASCTASGCHGGGSATNAPGSEYNVWISQDPHANAHSVLYDQASLRMVRLLDGKAPDEPVTPYADARCVSCHSTTVGPQRDPGVSLLSDGVGCEACHGPAEGWLAAHYQGRYRAVRAGGAALRDLEMWDTKDLVTRAQVCAACHVGGIGRDVNHDLIAAGHPRLQFDFGAYFRRLPPHWQSDSRGNALQDSMAWGDNLDAMVWAIGRAVGSRAALLRLAARASGSGPWPELAEWSCADCHHDLRDDVARQQRLAERGGLSGLTFGWDDWHHDFTQRHLPVVERAWGVDSALADKIQLDMSALSRIASSIQADRSQAGQRATELAGTMSHWIAKLRTTEPTPAGIERVFRDVAAESRERGLGTWTDAALAYDALASLHQSRIDGFRRRGAAADPGVSRTTQQIGALFRELSRTAPGSGRPFMPTAARRLLEAVDESIAGERIGQ